MKINKAIAIAVILFGLLVGGLGAGIFLTQRPQQVDAAPPAQQDITCVDDDGDVEHEADDDAEENDACEDADETGDVDEAGDVEDDDNGEANEADESDETNVSPDQMGITPEEAQAAAEAANPGAKTLAVEIDRVNENGGALIYEVELDNGIDVKVNANDGTILGTDVRDTD